MSPETMTHPGAVDPVGEQIVLWSVRLALACYLASVELRLLARNGERERLRYARLLWTTGYLAFLVHFFCAFHYMHHWSHQHAFEVTARRTAETVGTPFGAGIYVNHLFLLIWGLDVCWWNWRPASYLRRPRTVNLAIHVFMVFIAFHATVTFGQGVIFWWGLAGTALLCATILIRRIRGPVELARRPQGTL